MAGVNLNMRSVLAWVDSTTNEESDLSNLRLLQRRCAERLRSLEPTGHVAHAVLAPSDAKPRPLLWHNIKQKMREASQGDTAEQVAEESGNIRPSLADQAVVHVPPLPPEEVVKEEPVVVDAPQEHGKVESSLEDTGVLTDEPKAPFGVQEFQEILKKGPLFKESMKADVAR